MDDDEQVSLVERVADGDQDALQCLIVRYHVPLRRKIDAGAGRHVDPDDVLQEAYVSAFRAVSKGGFHSDAEQRDREAGFYRWLEAIALARLKDRERALRRRKRDVGRELQNPPNRATSLSGPDGSPVGRRLDAEPGSSPETRRSRH